MRFSTVAIVLAAAAAPAFAAPMPSGRPTHSASHAKAGHGVHPSAKHPSNSRRFSLSALSDVASAAGDAYEIWSDYDDSNSRRNLIVDGIEVGADLVSDYETWKSSNRRALDELQARVSLSALSDVASAAGDAYEIWNDIDSSKSSRSLIVDGLEVGADLVSDYETWKSSNRRALDGLLARNAADIATDVIDAASAGYGLWESYKDGSSRRALEELHARNAADIATDVFDAASAGYGLWESYKDGSSRRALANALARRSVSLGDLSNVGNIAEKLYGIYSSYEDGGSSRRAYPDYRIGVVVPPSA